MKVIGFAQGQYGDIVMGTICAKSFKIQHPNSKITLGVNKKYSDILPIFENNKYFDDFHIWDGYDNWPTQEDINYLNKVKYNFIYDPMPLHTEQQWYLNRHQTQELCLMHGLGFPKDLQIELNQYFNVENNKKMIAIVGGAVTRGSEKSLNDTKYEEIIDLVKKKGYEPVQLGGNDDKQICSNKFNGTFFEKIKFMLSTKLIISVDTSYSWLASGFSFPTLGLYSFSYYPNATKDHVKNWQPINKNGIFLSESNLNNIDILQIEEGLNKLL